MQIKEAPFLEDSAIELSVTTMFRKLVPKKIKVPVTAATLAFEKKDYIRTL